VRKATAAHVNLDLGVWVFKEHKTAQRTGRPRVIYLTPAMVELTRRLMEKHPEGPLFRGPRSERGFTQTPPPGRTNGNDRTRKDCRGS
jgi:hypothetical protein